VLFGYFVILNVIGKRGESPWMNSPNIGSRAFILVARLHLQLFNFHNCADFQSVIRVTNDTKAEFSGTLKSLSLL
jgi:hypothetical protein